MSLQYSTLHRTNAMQDLVTDIGATGYLVLCTGSPPANAAAAETGTRLVALPCSSTFGTVTNGVLTANAITTTAAIASGTVGYFRVYTSSAGTTCVIQGTVGTSGADLIVNSTTIATGVSIVVSSFVITAFGA